MRTGTQLALTANGKPATKSFAHINGLPSMHAGQDFLQDRLHPVTRKLHARALAMKHAPLLSRTLTVTMEQDQGAQGSSLCHTCREVT